MENFLVDRGALRYKFAAALFAVIFSAHVSLAQTVAVANNRPPQAATLSARAAATRPLNVHISFQLRHPEQLSKLLTDLQDPASPRYHQWLTPQEFDSTYGRTPSEVKAVSQWLIAHGFRVARSSGRELVSSANVSQAEEAFATTIVASPDGARYSNAVEPRIPARFANLIGSIDGLDNLRHGVRVTNRSASLNASKKSANDSDTPASLSRRGQVLAHGAAVLPSGSRAAFGDPNFGPQDLWTFYNETPPINGATDGSGGDCLGTIEDSDFLDDSVALFNSTFTLPPANITRVFSDSSSPGFNGDETEALVDIEWAHAAAPGAPINVYIGNPQFENVDPLTDSLVKAVSDNACGALSFTYVFCGAAPSFYSGTLGPVLVQAAVQGQSVFVATGDWGSAGLTASGDACVPATSQNVSEISANPFVTSVGGTQFSPVYNGDGNDVGSVPESAWANGAGATGGGKSKVFVKPSFQNSVTPNDGVRDIPDVALGASNVTPGFFWVDATGTMPVTSCCIGGTSLSAPVWAGISKLISQIAGKRLGDMNPRIYQLGALANTTRSGLRDVLSGNNTFNGVPGFNAAAGYDLATGWGSPDVQTFENAFLFASIAPTPTPTATPTPILPASHVTFVGAGTLTDTNKAVTAIDVSLPVGVVAGDIMLAQIVVHDGSAADVPTPPLGWISIRHDAVNNGLQETSWLYFKVAGSDEPFSYEWTIGANFAAGVMGAWRGAALSPIDKSSGAFGAGASPITVSAPALTPTNSGELQVYFYGGQAVTAPAIAPAAALNQRFNVGSSKEGFTLAFADVVASAAGIISPIYPAKVTISSGNAAMVAQAVLLIPALTATPTPTATRTATITATATPVITPTLLPTATGTPAATPTGTATGTATVVTTPTSTAVPSQTATPSPTPIASAAKIVAPAALNAGSVAIGLSTSKSFTIKNSGKGNLNGGITIVIEPPTRTSVFTIVPDVINLAPGQSQPETVTFSPDQISDSATAVLTSNDSTRPSIGVVLTGTGLVGKLSVPKTLAISGLVGQPVQVSLTIKNIGKGFLSGNWAPVSVAPYGVVGGSFGPLQPNASTTIPIIFTPTAKGNAPTVALVIGVLQPSTGSAIVTLKGVGK